MSKRKNARFGGPFWLLGIAVVGFYFHSQFIAIPSPPDTIPSLVTTVELLNAPEKYHNSYVMLADGNVVAPVYFFHRGSFWVESPVHALRILAISPYLRPKGAPLRNAVFYFEVLYSGEESRIMIMREVRRPD